MIKLRECEARLGFAMPSICAFLIALTIWAGELGESAYAALSCVTQAASSMSGDNTAVVEASH